jgi:hypothetical protein
VEGDRQVVKNLLLESLIVVLHVQEERLLVIQMEIVLNLVVQLGLDHFLDELLFALLLTSNSLVNGAASTSSHAITFNCC